VAAATSPKGKSCSEKEIRRTVFFARTAGAVFHNAHLPYKLSCANRTEKNGVAIEFPEYVDGTAEEAASDESNHLQFDCCAFLFYGFSTKYTNRALGYPASFALRWSLIAERTRP
jgi:hypothetical protein